MSKKVSTLFLLFFATHIDMFDAEARLLLYCMYGVWKFFEHLGYRKPWYLCLLSRILSSQFIFILVQFLDSRQSVSLPCLCVAGWWVALGSPACWLCPGMWSTGKTIPPCYWQSCVKTVFNKQNIVHFLFDNFDILIQFLAPPVWNEFGYFVISLSSVDPTQPKWTKLFRCGTTGLCPTSPARLPLWPASWVTTLTLLLRCVFQHTRYCFCYVSNLLGTMMCSHSFSL